MFSFYQKLTSLMGWEELRHRYIVIDFQFQFYVDVVKRRRQIADLYNENLRNLPNIILPPKPEKNSDNFDIFQNYEIEADNRDSLKDYLNENGIGTLIQWGGQGIHQFNSLGYDLSLPNSEKIFNRMLLLPLNMTISDDEINYVSDSIRKYYLNN